MANSLFGDYEPQILPPKLYIGDYVDINGKVAIIIGKKVLPNQDFYYDKKNYSLIEYKSLVDGHGSFSFTNSPSKRIIKVLVEEQVIKNSLMDFYFRPYTNTERFLREE
jgi:hypothetical protein